MKTISEEKALLIADIKESIAELHKFKNGTAQAKPARELLDELSEDELKSLKTGLEDVRLIKDGKLKAIPASEIWKIS